MSMKRSRRASTPARSNQEEGGFGMMGTPEAPASWAALVADKPDAEFKPYSMSTTFARNDLVLHPKFGKGVVVLVEGSRVEVLFEDGPRKLGHASG
jgi:hypothetical protein